MQGDTGSGHTTPDTTRPKEVLDEVMAVDQGSPYFRPTWLYGFNSKYLKGLSNMTLFPAG